MNKKIFFIFATMFVLAISIGLSSGRINELFNTNANLSSQLEQQEKTYSGRIDELTAYQETLIAKLNKLQENYSKLEVGYNNLQATYEAYIEESELKIENLKSELSDIKKTVSELEAQSEIDQAKIAELKTQIENLEKSINEKNVTIDELTSTIEAQKATIAELQATIDEIVADLNSDIAPLLISGDNSGETITLTAERLGNISKVRDYAFYQVKTPFSIELPDCCDTFGEKAFYSSGIISVSAPGVTLIPDYCFYDCVNLSLVNFGEVDSVGAYSFYNCALTDFDFSSLKVIPNYAFYGCSLVSVDLPNCLTEICSYAFANTNIKEIVIPEATACAADYIFYNCSMLEKISLPSNMIQIGSNCFYNCSSLTEIKIPDSVEYIKNFAFYGCSKLSVVHFPSSLYSIGFASFSGCNSLVNIELPEGCRSLGSEAFFASSDEPFRKVVLPSTVSSLGQICFGTSLISITFLSEKLVSVSSSCGFFYDNSIPVIYVPAESLEAYKTAKYWSQYADKIFAIEENTEEPEDDNKSYGELGEGSDRFDFGDILDDDFD